MRLAIVLLALVLAGCASPTGMDSEPTPTPDATGSTPTPTPAPTPTAPPPSERPPVDVALEHDYQDAPETVTFEIPAGAGDLTFDARFTGTAGGDGATTACQGVDARLVVKDPAGEVYSDQQASGVTVSDNSVGCGDVVTRHGATLAPGTWTVEFTGSGLVRGVVTVRSA